MRTLITGGAGFIGTNAAEYFISQGDEVIVYDNLSRKGSDLNLNYLQKKYPDQITFEEGDISKEKDFSEKLLPSIKKSDRVLHLAGQVAVTTSIDNPEMDFRNNALGTFYVLEALRKSNKEIPLIFSSTNKVYGELEGTLKFKEGETRYTETKFPEGIPENVGVDFHSPYGCSKGSADQYVRDYSRTFGLDTIVFRQSCIYGPRQMGVEDQGWVAWFTIASALDKPITFFGDGKQVRDLLHVNDLVKAYDLAFKNIETTRGKIYNIGGGPTHAMSLIEVMERLSELKETEIPVSYGDWREGDQKVCIMDITKAKKELGWSPRIDPNSGIGELWNWVEENKEMLEKIF
ncbi:CDP-paratose 2-epimerase [Candidatus Pacearchaeota archaeon]|nr:CDP-paratose 2-epimerase [Candidatus Pacearchaeota archaeon]|tara:strand:+ start:4567 stop:5607 length:1041 start_codon:yes stop_codon:yes gene_type:complete